jgi:hypothetical protein
MHSILARTQFEQGCLLSHLTCNSEVPCQSLTSFEAAEGRLTFLLRHVTHDRGFGVGAPPAERPLLLRLDCWAPSGEFSADGDSDMMLVCV